MMIMRTFAALDREASALFMGTANFGWTMPKEQCFEVLDAYAGMGGNVVDTARCYGAFGGPGYGTAEKIVGEWLRARGMRERIIISTKGGHPPVEDMTHSRLDPESLKRDLEDSLEALGVDSIDLYWLHRDDASRPVQEILETLNGFIEAHKVRAIGASNWSNERLREAWGCAYEHGLTGFSADQPMWSLAKAAVMHDPTLVQMDAHLYYWHRDSHMACMPFTSQAKGFFPKFLAGGEAALSDKARDRYLTDHNRRIADALTSIMAETGLSASAASLAFLTGQVDFPTFPIVGVSSMAQVEALREAGDATLSEAHMAKLMALTGLTDKAE